MGSDPNLFDPNLLHGFDGPARSDQPAHTQGGAIGSAELMGVVGGVWGDEVSCRRHIGILCVTIEL